MNDAHTHNQHLARNMFFMTVMVLSVNVCLFAINWILIRAYGDRFHGTTAWVVSVVGLAMIVSDLGLGKAGVRRIARQRASRPDQLGETISSLIVIRSAMGIIIAIAMFVAAGSIAEIRTSVGPQMIRLAAVWVGLISLVRAYMMIPIGFERTAYLMVTTPLFHLGRGIWVLVCVLFGLGLTWLMAGWAAAAVITACVTIWTIGRTKTFGINVRAKTLAIRNAPEIIAHAIPYHLPNISLLGQAFIMQLVIGYWHRQTPGGQIDTISLFQVAYTLAVVSRLLSGPISSAMMPRIAHTDASPNANHDLTAAVLQQVTRLLGLAATLIFAVYWTIGPQLLEAVYNPGYVAAMAAMLLLTVAVALDNYNQQLNGVLMAMRHIHVVAWLEIPRYIVLVAAGWWLVPTYGATGAAITVCITAAVNTACKILATRTKLRSIGLAPFVCTLATFAAITAVVLKTGPYLALPVWLVAAVGLRLLRPMEVLNWLALLRKMIFPRK